MTEPTTVEAAGHMAGHVAGYPTRQLVEVRCFAASRAALGFSTRVLDLDDVRTGRDGADAAVATVGDVVAFLASETPAAEPVLARCSVLLDGRRAAPRAAVPAGATLDLLPPFAGG